MILTRYDYLPGGPNFYPMEKKQLKCNRLVQPEHMVAIAQRSAAAFITKGPTPSGRLRTVEKKSIVTIRQICVSYCWKCAKQDYEIFCRHLQKPSAYE